VSNGSDDGDPAHADTTESTASLADLDVAVAHWPVEAWGGGEYLVTRLADALDVDRIHTLGEPAPADPNPYGDVRFENVRSSLDYAAIRRLQARAGRVFEYAQWEDVDWREFGDPDVLVTSGATTRAVITPEDTLHVHYCHSPARWLYDRYHDRKDSLVGRLARPLLRHLRTRDATIDARVDHYFANSPIIARRLWTYLKREATVLYPPIDREAYRDDGDDGYYLHLGRLDEEKGVPAIVDAVADTEHRLVLAGGAGDVDRSVRQRIEAAANIEYRGFVDEAEKRELLASCRALVFNGRREDFGIVPIEAAASGKPVLARNDGFPGVFVDDGENGFLHDGTAAGIRRALERLEADPEAVQPDPDRLGPFGREFFADRLEAHLGEWWEAFQVTGP
jgi:glycosyltransferase involved in cell wall biosynthesis